MVNEKRLIDANIWPDGKKWSYCPNCGAKMDLERKNNNAEN